jgi:hypothetical protein
MNRPESMAALLLNTYQLSGKERYACLKGQGIGFKGGVQKGWVEELFVVNHGDFPKFKKNPVNPTLITRGSAWI